jgi:predicted nucleic acid-binding protein
MVDTSVWIEFMRGKNNQIITKLNELLDLDEVVLSDIVYLEIINGAKRAEVERIRRLFSAFDKYTFNTEWCFEIEDFLIENKSKGFRFGIPDLMIAKTSSKSDLKLWTLDKDFHRLQKLGFVELFEG